MTDLADGAPEVACADDAVGLVDIRWGKEGSRVAYAQFEDLYRLVDPFEAEVAMALDSRTLEERRVENLAGRGGEERLPAAGEGHNAGGDGHGEALDLGTDGSQGDVGGSVLAEGDRPDMEANPGGQRKIGKCMVVAERIAGSVSRVVEQQEQAIGASDLTAAVVSEEVARPAVVLGPDLRRAGVAEALDHGVLSTTSVKRRACASTTAPTMPRATRPSTSRARFIG